MVSGSIENQIVKMDDNHLSIKLGKNLVVWDLPKSPSINNSIKRKEQNGNEK